MIRAYRTPLFLIAIVAFTAFIYWPGLSGGFLFDDYPNIVENTGLQIHHATFSSLVRAALSSPSSELKRPLSSMSLAINYLFTGLDPYWMKITNLTIHLINGLLVFFLARALLRASASRVEERRTDIVSLLVAASWLLLPINLTGVLYVVQRMESLANVFVLLGLITYVSMRTRMIFCGRVPNKVALRNVVLCFFGIAAFTLIGILAKETAAMLPLYAFLTECLIFGFARNSEVETSGIEEPPSIGRTDFRILGIYVIALFIPMVAGLTWLLPGVFNPAAWATRDFTLGTRLLSEARIVMDYVAWTIVPTPDDLSFYHDNFVISKGLLSPWTTLASIFLITALCGFAVWIRRRKPLVALGIAFFIASNLLTGTVLPLELIYEHRNYFASFGLMLAIVPLVVPPLSSLSSETTSFALPRWALLVALLLLWSTETFITAIAWGNPITLAEALAYRAPDSPRAQYELGRTYIVYSHYDPNSPLTKLAYAPLEKSAALPDASILAEQALIFMNARMHIPIKDAWWDSMIAKLNARKATVQDESSLGSLGTCARQGYCDLPKQRMKDAFAAALNHPGTTGRLYAEAGDYQLNVLEDTKGAIALFRSAVKATPSEPVYRVTLIRLLAITGDLSAARTEFAQVTPTQRLMLDEVTLRQLSNCLAPEQKDGTACATNR